MRTSKSLTKKGGNYLKKNCSNQDWEKFQSIVDIDQLIRTHFKVDPYGMTYLNNLYQAEREYGKKGIKVQVLYVLNNAKSIGPEGKKLRKELTKWAYSSE